MASPKHMIRLIHNYNRVYDMRRTHLVDISSHSHVVCLVLVWRDLSLETWTTIAVFCWSNSVKNLPRKSTKKYISLTTIDYMRSLFPDTDYSVSYRCRILIYMWYIKLVILWHLLFHVPPIYVVKHPISFGFDNAADSKFQRHLIWFY